ncbi:MAG: hypothetical protein Q9213_006855 [Squamulea squamosa]
MPELFSKIAGVASLIDVALRACNVLYDSSCYLKDAPQLSQRLQRTIESVKSVLQSLNDLLALHRQQQATSGVPDILPGAVENEIISIKAVLDTLSTLLPTSSANSQVRTQVKWILDRKKVTEVVKELDSHQITLALALQTFTHGNNSRVYDHFLHRLERNYTKTLQDHIISGTAGLHADLTNLTQTYQALLPAQEALRSGLNNFIDAVSTGQSTLNTRLEDISTTLSHISVRNNHLQSSMTVTAPSEGLLAPIVRAELRRVIMPAVQQCLEKYKASPDRQLDDIRKKIDEMAQQLYSRSSGDGISSSSSSTPSSSHSHIHQDSVDLINPCDLRTSTFGASQHQNQAKIPNDAEVMECARRNDVEGLQSFFQRGLAAPSDRDIDGRTPLMHAVNDCSADVCRFLLNEGSDTKATDTNELTLFDHANQGFGRPKIHGDRVAIINMLQHLDGDILEHRSEYYLFNALSVRSFYSESVRSEHHSAYLQQLKQLGIRFLKDSLLAPPIWLWIMAKRVRNVSVTIKPGNIEFVLQTMLEFGADSNARSHGDTPFHLLFRDNHFGDDTRLNVQRHNLMEIAKALLKHGADPFALNDYGASVLDIAEKYGWTTELDEVLQQTGYDLDEVRLKIFLAKWVFYNPDEALALSTTIDSNLYKPLSRAGLSLRRAMPGDRLED